MYNLLANVTILLHFLFIVFVVCGGLLVIRWPRVAFVHLPAAVWGAVVEIFGWVCPLTPLENYFRGLAGDSPYGGDFIGRYFLPLIYPENLTAAAQQILGGLVIIVNVIFYTIAIRRYRSPGKKCNEHAFFNSFLPAFFFLIYPAAMILSCNH